MRSTAQMTSGVKPPRTSPRHFCLQCPSSKYERGVVRAGVVRSRTTELPKRVQNTQGCNTALEPDDPWAFGGWTHKRFGTAGLSQRADSEFGKRLLKCSKPSGVD